MIIEATLIFDDGSDPIHCDDIFSLNPQQSSISLLSLEAKVDTREFTLSSLGDLFPGMRKLRLNNSIIPSIRDIGCTLGQLTFLSLARCNLTSLDGIATISKNLEELYLAFNKLTDVCDLMGMEKLRFVDLEDNLLENIENIQILNLCPGLTALTLIGNPASKIPDYRLRVNELLPQLIYLDEKRIAQKSKKAPRVIFRSPTHGEVSPIWIPTEDLENERNTILTQQIDDIVNGRPPSARGNYQGFEFSEIVKVKGVGQKLLSPRSPRIFRPRSTRDHRDGLIQRTI
jgi:hypothetical protein